MRNLKRCGPLWVLLILLLLGMSGAQKPARRPMRLTLRAQIIWQDQSFLYEEPQKLTSVLTWLRLLRPGRPVSTVPEEEHLITVTLYHSDHTRTVYRLYGLAYLTTDGRVFRPVNGVYAQQIFKLLHLLPPDGS